jgi:predicted nuclease with RNAse H fold
VFSRRADLEIRGEDYGTPVGDAHGQTQMRIVGIDLSGPRNFADTCLVSFEEHGEEIHIHEIREGADDDQILEVVSSRGPKEPIVIGIDAPLSYNPRGGERPSDSELRRVVHAQGGHVGVMSPTLIRMVYLTLRGLQLTRLLERFKPQYDLRIVEVHPGACMLLRGADPGDVQAFKIESLARGRLLDWLGTKGLKGIQRTKTITDHYVAACAAALAAWQWGLGKPVWHFAADLPHHPYDFAC